MTGPDLASRPEMRWLFRCLAAHDPDTVAIEGVSRRFSYGELIAAVDGVAQALGERLARHAPGAPVLITAPRSRPDAVIAVLSLWRLGLVPVLSRSACAWVQDGTVVIPPILCPATDAAAVLEDTAVLSRAGDADELLVVGTTWVLGGGRAIATLPCRQPAYVIGTSGTTGPPAPVLNHADSLQATVAGLLDRYRLGTRSRALLFAPFEYDAALADTLPVLVAGGVLVCCDDGAWQRPTALTQRIHDARVTHAVLPPSVLRLLAPTLARAQTSLDVLVSAGEQLDVSLAKQLVPVASRVVNAYGPSEAAICLTTFDVREPVNGTDGGAVPVGRPLPGVRIELLDDAGRPVGPGTPGRVVARGRPVAHGYLQPPSGPERTDRFRPDPGAEPADMTDPCQPQLLNTGDQGMLTDAGDLVLIGRSDDEAKLHGHRVQLAAVEASLRTLPDVMDAVVAVHQDRLCCLWVPASPGLPGPRPAGAAQLPPPVPSVWHAVSTLPTTASDKVDRAAARDRIQVLFQLAQGGHPMPTAPPVVGDEQDLAAVLRGLWRRHLGAASAGGPSADDFFVAGGDSLRAMELLDDLETETGTYIDLADFLEAPTIQHLATLLGRVRRIDDKEPP